MSGLLFFRQIAAGYWAAGDYTIRRSRFARQQWIVREGDREIGFRPTLEGAKRLAERKSAGVEAPRAPAGRPGADESAPERAR